MEQFPGGGIEVLLFGQQGVDRLEGRRWGEEWSNFLAAGSSCFCSASRELNAWRVVDWTGPH